MAACGDGPRWTLIAAGWFAASFILALTIIRINGGRGGEAVLRVLPGVCSRSPEGFVLAVRRPAESSALGAC
ncbi:hypothetical protein PUR49_04575 [Streptomyces sp. BE147]|nr:hypothetical protein [Streptomyces sp. BE147]